MRLWISGYQLVVAHPFSSRPEWQVCWDINDISPWWLLQSMSCLIWLPQHTSQISVLSVYGMSTVCTHSCRVGEWVYKVLMDLEPSGEDLSKLDLSPFLASISCSCLLDFSVDSSFHDMSAAVDWFTTLFYSLFTGAGVLWVLGSTSFSMTALRMPELGIPQIFRKLIWEYSSNNSKFEWSRTGKIFHEKGNIPLPDFLLF